MAFWNKRATDSMEPHPDDSVTVKGKGHPEYSGKHITRGGEEYAREEAEAGRVGDKSTARFVTGVRPQNPIDKKSPNLS